MDARLGENVSACPTDSQTSRLSQIDEALIAQLVDDELGEEERRDLLLRLDRLSGGWRACAIAFLEAQTFRKALRSFSVPTTDSDSIGTIESEKETTSLEVVRIEPKKRNKFPRRLYALASTAACVLIIGSVGSSFVSNGGSLGIGCGAPCKTFSPSLVCVEAVPEIALKMESTKEGATPEMGIEVVSPLAPFSPGSSAPEMDDVFSGLNSLESPSQDPDLNLNLASNDVLTEDQDRSSVPTMNNVFNDMSSCMDNGMTSMSGGIGKRDTGTKVRPNFSRSKVYDATKERDAQTKGSMDSGMTIMGDMGGMSIPDSRHNGTPESNMASMNTNNMGSCLMGTPPLSNSGNDMPSMGAADAIVNGGMNSMASDMNSTTMGDDPDKALPNVNSMAINGGMAGMASSSGFRRYSNCVPDNMAMGSGSGTVPNINSMGMRNRMGGGTVDGGMVGGKLGDDSERDRMKLALRSETERPDDKYDAESAFEMEKGTVDHDLFNAELAFDSRPIGSVRSLDEYSPTNDKEEASVALDAEYDKTSLTSDEHKGIVPLAQKDMGKDLTSSINDREDSSARFQIATINCPQHGLTNVSTSYIEVDSYDRDAYRKNNIDLPPEIEKQLLQEVQDGGRIDSRHDEYRFSLKDGRVFILPVDTYNVKYDQDLQIW